MLKTSITEGLTDSFDIENHKNWFGCNFIKPKLKHGRFYYIYRAFNDEMLIFLIFAAIITFITEIIQNPKGYGLEGISIFVAVILIVTVTAENDYNKEKQFHNLYKIIKSGNTCSVIRNGDVIEIPTTDLVVGDIYIPNYGDCIPADCLVFEEKNLKVDESSLTGESNLVHKNIILDPYLLSGTYIMEGCGKAIVIGVGIYSQTGRILSLMKKNKQRKIDKNKKKTKVNEKSNSIIQEKLKKLARTIGYIGIGAGILVFIILIIRFCLRNYIGINAKKIQLKDFKYLVDFLITGISIVIVSVPEGLPLAVTLSLAYSVSKMLKENNLVRQLHSCETMGNATTICSDKTGTLTTNRMTVVEYLCSGNHIKDMKQKLNISNNYMNALCMNICFNKSPTSILKVHHEEGVLPLQIGNKTDCALLGFLKNLDTTYDYWIKGIPESSVIKMFPFNSTKKMMTTIIKLDNNQYRILIKGASEVLLPFCKKEISMIGDMIIDMTSNNIENIKNKIKEMNENALRTILLAYKDIENADIINEEDLLYDLIFLIIVGIEDPVRDDVPEAIYSCERAGVTVRMITGDNLQTAKAIALKCGILRLEDRSSLVIDSDTFNKLIRDNEGNISQTNLDNVWPKLKVLARSTPLDKFILVDGIMNTNLSSKQIVAVTGDGTNDAPALKRSDVGFAMGKTGTDISKEACDIILTDDNFASIVRALLWGRNVYDSISKFIQFQLTVNSTAIICSILTSIIYGENIFKPTQLLWVNLIMDSFASLALSTDSPSPDLLNRKPYPREKSLLSKNMIIFILFHSLYQIITILLLVFCAPTFFCFDNHFKLDEYNEINGFKNQDTLHSTFIFNAFVIMQIFNQINARKLKNEYNVFDGIIKNKIFLIITAITIVFQILMINFTYSFFHVVPLTLELWLWSVLIGVSECVYHQIVVIKMHKFIHVPKFLKKIASIDNNDFSYTKLNETRSLWIRGNDRIIKQMRVIDAFKTNLEIKKYKFFSDDTNSSSQLYEYSENEPPFLAGR